MKDLIVEYEIVNWEKYNPRSDVKQVNWFRCDADMPMSAALSTLDDKTFRLWFTLLARSCRGRGRGHLSMKSLSSLVHTKVIKTSSCLSALQDAGMIRFETKLLSQTWPLRNGTERNETIRNDIPSIPPIPPTEVSSPKSDEPEDAGRMEGREKKLVLVASPASDRFPADFRPDDIEVLRYAEEKLERVVSPQEAENFVQTWRKNSTVPKSRLLTAIDWLSGHPLALRETQTLARIFYDKKAKQVYGEWDRKIWKTIEECKSAGMTDDSIRDRIRKGCPTLDAGVLDSYLDRMLAHFGKEA